MFHPQIRSMYRILEATIHNGNTGLAKSEAAFFGLDAFPIWFSMVGYVAVWPGQVLYSLEAEAEGSSKSSTGETIRLEGV